MKLSKKILAAFSVAAMLVTAALFVGCKEEEDDEDAIKGWTVDYTNSSSTDIYRAFESTSFKHLGEIVKITFNNQDSASHDGVMGFIWDMRQSKSVTGAAITEEGYRNFFVFGFNGCGVTSNNEKVGPRYYISKYFNIPEGKLNEDNFGAMKNTTDADTVDSHAAGITETAPKELVVRNWKKLDGLSIAEDKTLTVWLDVYPVYENSKYGVDIANHSSDDAGSYVVDIYDNDPRSTKVTATKLDSVKIGTDKTGYTAKPSQGLLAKYFNVQPSKTLSGSWNFAKDYAEAEVVEE